MKWKENIPALKFLGIFLGVYLIGNLLYGFYVEWHYPPADPVTQWVANQSAALLQFFTGSEVSTLNTTAKPTVMLIENNKSVLRVYEGCNGLNVMVVFVAFIMAFGGVNKRGAWFTIIGCVVIHLANLGRVSLLFVVAKNYQSYFYFVHKYLFTAILYLIVFALWWLWVAKFKKAPTGSAS